MVHSIMVLLQTVKVPMVEPAAVVVEIQMVQQIIMVVRVTLQAHLHHKVPTEVMVDLVVMVLVVPVVEEELQELPVVTVEVQQLQLLEVWMVEMELNQALLVPLFITQVVELQDQT